MITPRATRLIRAGGAQAFREAAVALACDGAPLDARDRLVVVPTRAAAAHLLRGIEDAVTGRTAQLLPDFITPADLAFRFGERLPPDRPILTPAEREVLLVVACRTVRAAGIEPPFHVRPALVAEILAWYDELRRHQHDVASFERLALAALEPGAIEDRGAERLVRQTRFLVAAFREFERAVAGAGADEHTLRRAVIETPAERPIRHVVLTVADRSVDPHGLAPADWDLLARVPRLERLDVLVTDGRLAGALHERLHHVLPGIEEVRFDSHGPDARPVLFTPSAESAVYSVRDREEEVAAFARQVKTLIRSGEASSLDRVAFVVDKPLPYVYVAPAILRSGGIPCRLSESLPLAAEPYAAALDLVLSCVETNFGRASVLALLGSPHFRFAAPGGDRVDARALARACDVLPAVGGTEGQDLLDRLAISADDDGAEPAGAAAADAIAVVRGVIAELGPMLAPAPVAEHLERLLQFVTAREVTPAEGEPWRERHLRARGAVLGTVAALRDAYARFDTEPVAFDEVAALIRRWLDGQTFAPPGDETGLHIVDAASAPFGSFEHVHLAGLVDGEWPQRRRRSIFYSAGVLRDLGWPADGLRLEGARAAFADLLTLPARSAAASTFLLENDALVTPSPFVEELERLALERMERPIPAVRILEDEALALEPVPHEPLDETVRMWISLRRGATQGADSAVPEHGQHVAERPIGGRAYSLSALERYQDCPFRFFAASVLRLPEPAEEGESLSPRERGRFVHEVLQRFFEAWDAETSGAPIDVSRLDEARALCMRIADPLLARLGDADAALERARLFGSAISTGIVDVALAVEVAYAGEVDERWLEHRFEGAFTLGSDRRVALKGVADRVDLLKGQRLRVVDYKTGQAPDPRRALQAIVYALCLQETLSRRDRAPWTIAEAAYVSFAGRRSFVPVVQGGGAAAEAAIESARSRVFAVLDGIARAEFPPRPHEPLLCRSCAYPSVCRKEYVDD